MEFNASFGLTAFERILICSWILKPQLFFDTSNCEPLKMGNHNLITWSCDVISSILAKCRMISQANSFTPRRTMWRHNNRAKLKSDRNLENRIQLNSKITPDVRLPTKLFSCQITSQWFYMKIIALVRTDDSRNSLYDLLEILNESEWLRNNGKVFLKIQNSLPGVLKKECSSVFKLWPILVKNITQNSFQYFCWINQSGTVPPMYRWT